MSRCIDCAQFPCECTKESLEGDSTIDAGILHAVQVLNANGIETFSSCEGGGGTHAFQIPNVCFGMSDKIIDMSVGPIAWAIAKGHGLNPWRLSLHIFPDEGISEWKLEFEDTTK